MYIIKMIPVALLIFLSLSGRIQGQYDSRIHMGIAGDEFGLDEISIEDETKPQVYKPNFKVVRALFAQVNAYRSIRAGLKNMLHEVKESKISKRPKRSLTSYLDNMIKLVDKKMKYSWDGALRRLMYELKKEQKMNGEKSFSLKELGEYIGMFA